MKRFRYFLAAAVAAAIFVTQPAMAAEGTPVVVQPSYDSQSGGPGVAAQKSQGEQEGAPGQIPGSAGDQEQTAPEQPQEGNQEQAAPEQPQEGNPEQAVPEQPQESSQERVPGESVQPAPQEPSGDSSVTPVVVAGQGGDQTVTGPAAKQAAEEEAARLAAEEAARQAAEEAARQAEEEAARQAAAAQGRQVFTRQLDPSRPMVALTFDDGPQTSVGNQIMDCLAQYGGKATFFMVGSRVPAHAAEVQRMVAEGHEVANHTMNHKYLQKLNGAQIQAEVNQCNDTIQAVCGVRPSLMRLPGGNHNATVLASTGMPMIQWNIDTRDWKTRNADQTVAAVLSQVKNGDIVLMHELYGQTGEAVLRIIPELANRGYQLVTVSEMAAARGRGLEAGKLYFSLP